MVVAAMRLQIIDESAPRRADKGFPGMGMWIWLRLKLIADAGWWGCRMPASRPSLRPFTARPKIADYPFTTLHPGLGVVAVDDQEFVLADIPGLVEGAHEGTGLATAFSAMSSAVRCCCIWLTAR